MSFPTILTKTLNLTSEFACIEVLDVVGDRDFVKIISNPTFNDNFRLLFVVSGKHFWLFDKVSSEILPDDLVVLLPSDTLEVLPNPFTDGLICYVSLKIFDEKKKKLLFPKSSNLSMQELKIIFEMMKIQKPLIIKNFKRGREILSKLIGELKQKEIAYRARVQSLIEEILIVASRSHFVKNVVSSNFKEIFDHLDLLLTANISHPWTVGEMAGLAGMGVTKFTEKVKHHTGFSPINYLIHLRIQKAIILMKNHNFTITKVALETGFYSSQHFSSSFKKVTGQNPSRYENL